MKFTKLLLCVLLVVPALFAFSHTSTEAATRFKDINEKHRAYKEIEYLAQGNIVNGRTDGRFLPNQNVTRAEAAAFIGRALNLDGTKRSTSFKDVGASNFASGYIQSAVNKKIISGYGNGTFKPYENITRGEMAIMISRAFGYDFGNTTSGAAKALMSRGIAQGVSNGSFGESLKIIRADFSVFLARSIDYKLRLKPTITFSGEKYVNTQGLNVRTGPLTYYPSIGTLNKDEIVQIGYNVGNWTLIKSDKFTGFVNSKYLSNTISSGGDGGSDNGELSSEVIVIDPGHGNQDPGAIGFGLKEKDVVLDVSLRVKKLIAQTPFTVKLTRETDVFLELSERVAFAQKVNGTTFVSVHANSFNGSASGSETYYYGASKATNPNVSDSKLLATKIQDRLVVAMETQDRGEKHGNFHVLRENTMPAVLVELGFIDNKSDNAKLASNSYRTRAANAIYLGILDYYKAKGFSVDHLYSVVK
ncbi:MULTISPECIES: N-acetylmuramoyl-L-alanine amidase [Bacillus]|uniref:N-acetylmuramoyl-L-alanine amidase n=1 Tax=Bacillus TaxID=1386 RepID=UPI00031F653E|nr:MULTISPECIES: N-acetylmuramoyl-L-alanine amidase [Bacillus]